MKRKILNHFRSNYVSFYGKYLPKLKKVGGDELAALCPFHEDSNPSFNFDNQSGKYYCHGCGKKGDIFHFYSKIHGMDTRRDFRKILRGIADDFGIPWEQQKSRVVAKYDYMDSEGNLLFQVCRMDPKSFRQRRPDGNGWWIWSLKGVDPVPYNLPSVIQADEVLVVEGEKDVDNLSKLGFTATCNPMGAKKWRDNYSDFLKGTEFKLIQTESEKYEWVFANLKQERKKEILKMLDEGFDYNAISEALGISKGYITKIKKQAIKDGYLTTKCKLTPSGFDHVSD